MHPSPYIRHIQTSHSNGTNTMTKHVIITTSHRGVFFGRLLAHDADKHTATLADCRMAIYWGTTRGLFELANTGPTEKSKISAPAPEIVLNAVTAVIDCTDDAVTAWTR